MVLLGDIAIMVCWDLLGVGSVLSWFCSEHDKHQSDYLTLREPSFLIGVVFDDDACTSQRCAHGENATPSLSRYY